MYVYGFNSLCICILAVLSRCFVTLIHLYTYMYTLDPGVKLYWTKKLEY